MDFVIDNQNIHAFAHMDNLFQAAAQDFLTRTTETIRKKGVCNVALSGGNTPKKFYAALLDIKKSIDWNNIRFFFGDERFVPFDDERSNYHTANEFLFSKVPVPSENIFRVPTELSSAVATAQEYEKSLRELFLTSWPGFDITYLGMGNDGHTASLMPFTDLVKNYVDHPGDALPAWVAGLWVEPLKMFRITLTPPAINHSQHIVFLVEGVEKAPALKQVLEVRNNALQYPAILIQQASWFVDNDAASQLEPSQ